MLPAGDWTLADMPDAAGCASFAETVWNEVQKLIYMSHLKTLTYLANDGDSEKANFIIT